MASASSSSVVYLTPIGPLKLVANGDGMTAVKFLFGRHGATRVAADMADSSASEELEREGASGTVDRESGNKDNFHLEVCKKWLDAYFDGGLLGSHPPPRPKLVLARKNGFVHTVWETLASTSIGDTLSYKELARLSGNPKAARVVGRAMKSHSIPILVPCHRVLRAGEDPWKGGSVGNYSGGDGVATKTWLLEHEKRMVEQHLVAEDSD